MKKTRIIIVTAIITTILLISVYLLIEYSCKKTEKPQKVKSSKPVIGTFTEVVSATGIVNPKKKVSISAKVSARIVEIPYEEGDKVTSGNSLAEPPISPSILLRLDDKDLQSQLRLVEASKKAQEAQIKVEKALIESQKAKLKGMLASLEQAKNDKKRHQKLYLQNETSPSDYDKLCCKYEELLAQYEAAKYNLKASQLNLDVLKYNLDAACARIEEAKEKLTYTTITSPINGIITNIKAEVGELVVYGTMNNAGTVIMEVADLSKMIVEAQVDERNITKIKIGQNVSVNIHAFPNKKFKGKVSFIGLTHNYNRMGTKYYKTEILLQTDGERLYGGLTADVEIETYKYNNVLLMPSHAVLGRRVDSLPLKIQEKSKEINKKKAYATVVYRLIKNKAIVTPVKVGPNNMSYTIIKAGLKKEDEVVVGPYKILEKIKHNQSIEKKLEENSIKNYKGISGGAKDKNTRAAY